MSSIKYFNTVVRIIGATGQKRDVILNTEGENPALKIAEHFPDDKIVECDKWPFIVLEESASLFTTERVQELLLKGGQIIGYKNRELHSSALIKMPKDSFVFDDARKAHFEYLQFDLIGQNWYLAVKRNGTKAQVKKAWEEDYREVWAMEHRIKESDKYEGWEDD